MKPSTGSTSAARVKPKKPRPDYPLQAYGNGQWAKKICGVRRCFGSWDDPQAAEATYWKEKADWEAGRNPRLMPTPAGSKEFWECWDRWLVMRHSLITASDPNEQITPTTYQGSLAAAHKAMEIMGEHVDPLTRTPEDWRRLKVGLGAGVATATKRQRMMYTLAMLDWNVKEGHLARMPNFGGQFNLPSAADIEEYRYGFEKEHGQRRFELEQARRILRTLDELATQQPGNWGYHAEMKTLIGRRLLRACTYLALNTGANSKDIACLTSEDIDLEKAYLERLRSKTKTLWQATLWPETVQAIRDYLEVRPKPDDPALAKLVFLTAEGYPVNHGQAKVRDTDRDNRSDALRQSLSKLLVKLGMKRKGVTFGAWRHTFRSLVADALGLNVKDVMQRDAVNRLMAHRIPGSANNYVKLRPEQLRPYTDAVRAKLWPATAAVMTAASSDAQSGVYTLPACGDGSGLMSLPALAQVSISGTPSPSA